MSPILELEAVNTKYGDSQVLFDVSMNVEEGEVVALLGRNGAGKTTTLRSIMGIQPPFKGNIRFQGEEIGSQRTYNIARKGIGYVPETREIFPLITVEEHIKMLVDESDRSKAETLEYIYNIFPNLEEKSNQKGRNLSGGEQQMLAIARTLVGQKDLLLLDEPSEGLAPQIVEQVFKTINRIKEDTTLLLVEQNYYFARAVADRYYILDNGQIVTGGEMQELEENEELKDKYLGIS